MHSTFLQFSRTAMAFGCTFFFFLSGNASAQQQDKASYLPNEPAIPTPLNDADRRGISNFYNYATPKDWTSSYLIDGAGLNQTIGQHGNVRLYNGIDVNGNMCAVLFPLDENGFKVPMLTTGTWTMMVNALCPQNCEVLRPADDNHIPRPLTDDDDTKFYAQTAIRNILGRYVMRRGVDKINGMILTRTAIEGLLDDLNEFPYIRVYHTSDAEGNNRQVLMMRANRLGLNDETRVYRQDRTSLCPENCD